MFRLGRDLQLRPPEGETSKLVTAALPYMNNTPHLGNIVGCVLSGDVWARFERLRGHNCLYVGGTDEYGTATELKAHQEGMTPMQVCDRYFPEHRNTYEWLNIGFDIFGRTTNPHHPMIAQEIFRDLRANGFISEETHEYTYCTDCNKFIADRLIRGICPNETCKFHDAKGDQCDKCNTLFDDPSDLIEPKCCFCKGSNIAKRPSTHAWLDLPAFKEEIEAKIPKSDESDVGRWSTNARSTTQEWIDDKKKKRQCISRDLVWGVPVPGMNNKVFYVWYDAPIGYISFTELLLRKRAPDDPSLNWETWWKRDEKKNVELVQFMGKDNTKFHTIHFPSMCLGTGRGLITVERISATHYLDYQGKKFSKSRGIGVFGPDMMASGLEPDYWRFYLLWRRPESGDSSFKWDEFADYVQSKLNDDYGNCVLRTVTLFVDHCLGQPPFDVTEALMDEKFQFSQHFKDYCTCMERFEMRGGLEAAFGLSKAINGYIDTSKPFNLAKQNQLNEAVESISICLAGILAATVLLHPFIPERTYHLLEWFGLLKSAEEGQNIRLKDGWKLYEKIDRALLEPRKALPKRPKKEDTEEEKKEKAKVRKENRPPLFHGIKEITDDLKKKFRPKPRDFVVRNEGITWPFVILHFFDLSITQASSKVKALLNDIRSQKVLATSPEVREERLKAYQENRVKDGVDDGKFLTSVQNLEDQVAEQKKLPSLSTAVDIYNALSLASATVTGFYDCENIEGNTIRYRKASGKETFHAVGRRPRDHTVDFRPGDWALIDEWNNIITLCLTKQSSRVEVKRATTEAIMCIQGSPVHTVDDLMKFAETMRSLIHTHCGGESRLVPIE